MSAGQEGNQGQPATAEGCDEDSDGSMPRVDHLSTTKVPKRLRTSSESKVDLGQIEIQVGVEEFLLRGVLA
jgi:hypothetical protein